MFFFFFIIHLFDLFDFICVGPGKVILVMVFDVEITFLGLVIYDNIVAVDIFDEKCTLVYNRS